MALIRVCCVAHQEKGNGYLWGLITKSDAPNQTSSVLNKHAALPSQNKPGR